MSYRALVAKIDPDTNNVKYVYLHDGHPYEAGRMLVEYYQDEAKIDELISGGFMSYLGANIGEKTTRQEHSDSHFKWYWNDEFDRPEEKDTQCLFYIRDVGESLEASGPREVTHDEFFNQGVDDMDAEALYVRSQGNVWFYATKSGGTTTADFPMLRPLHNSYD